VWNLVNNAVKFTPNGGRIDVRLRRTESHVEITVADNGQGVHPDLLPHLFERFRQGDARTTRSHGGLGLGLAIVKQLVEMHGGTVTASSAGEGKGAAFTVTLPVSSPADNAHKRTPRGGAAPGDSGTARAATGGGEGGHAEAATSDRADPTPLTPLEGIRILVVDDEPDARDLMKRLLRECSATVATAKCVADALELIDSFQPHVLVSDIGMPQRDGYDLIRLVRARGHTPRSLPAVALTAFARPEDRLKAVHAGYQVHIAKPINPSELSAVIADLVGEASTQ
jgi:CheY-like chemotaxis protein